MKFVRCIFWCVTIAAWLVLATLPDASAKEPGVIINEIMYHPPNEQEELQFVELFNRGEAEVDLSGWAFTKGIKFTFPASTRLARGGYVVVCRNRERFVAHYGTNVVVLGNFSGKLSHQGDRVELADAQHAPVDSVKYSDHTPWPGGADGHSSSLERISPGGRSDDAENWAASSPPATKTAGGTPGARNTVFSEIILPAVSEVAFTPMVPTPQQPVRITATVADVQSVKTVVLVWRRASTSPDSSEESVPMQRISGDEKRGVYEASIPAQSSATLVRFRIKAVNAGGASRLQPHENELRPNFSYFSFSGTNSALVPLSYVFTTGARERSAPRYGRTIRSDQVAARGNGAFIYVPAGGGALQVFDHVRVSPRHGGFKVHFWKDQPFK
ncbi:MAG: lamin tail domain-containing protein, partial [Verrucomicrobia bacterium]|nr:lamin tail domain-containing protein [Verrucomicrobiota bacterium]